LIITRLETVLGALYIVVCFINDNFCCIWTGWYSYLWLPFIPLIVSKKTTHSAYVVNLHFIQLNLS